MQLLCVPTRTTLPCHLPALQAFTMLPAGIRSELLEERDPHGNVQVGRGLGWQVACGTAHWQKKAAASQPRHPRKLSTNHTCPSASPPPSALQVSHIETEKLLIKMVAAELARRKVAGAYTGKFAALAHFFG